MKKQYEGKEILSFITARLVPPYHNYPDAECSVIMTEDSFNVLEDNYDGTFTCHFMIPLKNTMSVKKYTTEIQRNSVNNPYAIPQSSIANVPFLRRTDSELDRRNTYQMKFYKTYLEVYYVDKKGKVEVIFFENCNKIRCMVNAFNKYSNASRKRRGLRRSDTFWTAPH